MSDPFVVSGQLVDLHRCRVLPATVHVAHGRVERIEPVNHAPEHYLLPGFIDAHFHVESSMLPPSELARATVVHGTVATVSDPHEIANVLGTRGVAYMLEDGRRVPFHFAFGAPSCVPATPFETSGATLDAQAVAALLDQSDVSYLSEVMNYPGVLRHDPQLIAKIEAARQRGKPRDGHAPGLRGEAAEAYAAAGLQTDHECVAIDEARDKLAAGMRILIREGSAAKNFDELIPLMGEAPHRLMFCSDDKHPDALLEGHIDALVRRAVGYGYDPFDVLRAACVHPVEHYGLQIGLLREGDPADFIVVDDLDAVRVRQTYVQGQLVAEHGQTRIERVESPVVNRFAASAIEAGSLAVAAHGGRIRVMVATDHQVLTGAEVRDAAIDHGHIVADVERDILKLVVVNRYRDAEPAVAFVRGFGLRQGALASSVAHDSHNVVAVGTSDAAIAEAVNAVIDDEGGIGAVSSRDARALPLPIAGLMSDQPYDEVARRYAALDGFVQHQLGSPMANPFMTLSFMALLVIPRLKLSDQGLFDGEAFDFVDLFVE